MADRPTPLPKWYQNSRTQSAAKKQWTLEAAGKILQLERDLAAEKEKVAERDALLRDADSAIVHFACMRLSSEHDSISNPETRSKELQELMEWRDKAIIKAREVLNRIRAELGKEGGMNSKALDLANSSDPVEIRSMMHATDFLPHGHFIIEFMDGTQKEFEHFSEFGAWIMKELHRSRESGGG